MAGDSTYAVQDFLEALTAQLDRTQDSLALKAVNRPLTYAIRDFSLSLQVFVELSDDGQVRFRSSGPSETGASTVSIGFTTITRPMIEENTVNLSDAKSPSLDELGLAPQEQRQLERLGVRNADQLRKLNSSSGEGALARFADVPVNRLRAALQAGSPSVRQVAPERPPTEPVPPNTEQEVRVPAGTRRLRLDGRNLGALTDGGSARLDGIGVPIVAATDDHAVIDLGHLEASGRLELELGDGVALAFQLRPETAQVNGLQADRGPS
ncbi:hypothetical protein [Kribbella lupini]|uniref:Uncharacterized protein n=1 Tax=Kribbella lupini TaxID=291602 RepID=A0ABP4LB73_9ACTN